MKISTANHKKLTASKKKHIKEGWYLNGNIYGHFLANCVQNTNPCVFFSL
jgi:hypothetical protein